MVCQYLKNVSSVCGAFRFGVFGVCVRVCEWVCVCFFLRLLFWELESSGNFDHHCALR